MTAKGSSISCHTCTFTNVILVRKIAVVACLYLRLVPVPNEAPLLLFLHHYYYLKCKSICQKSKYREIKNATDVEDEF